MEKHSKHIDIRYHYICELIECGDVQVLFVQGAENPADILTKALPLPKVKEALKLLGLTGFGGSVIPSGGSVGL